MSKTNSMTLKETVERTEKGEQMDFMEHGPENLKEILEAARTYRGHLKDRQAALKLEVEWKEKVKALVKESDLQPLKDGTIKFTHGRVTVCIKPRDELITITEEKPKKPKKSKKGKK